MMGPGGNHVDGVLELARGWVTMAGGLRAVLLVLAAASVGCSASSSAPPDQVDTPSSTQTQAGQPLERRATTPDEGGECSATQLSSDDVYLAFRAKDAPEMKGGAITDGTYDLVEDVLYTGPGGTSGETDEHLALTLVVDGSLFELVRREHVHPHSFSGSLRFNGETVTAVTECPEEDWEPMAYTADGDTLTLSLGGIVPEVITLRLRPTN